MLELRRSEIIEKLRKLFNRLDYVRVAILFGSVARGCKYPHDIDIGVKFSSGKSLLDLAGFISLVAGELGVSEDLVDIVDLDDVKPILLLRILRDGIVLKGDLDSLRELYDKALRGIDQLIEVKLWAILDPEPKVDKVVITSRVEEIRRNALFIKREILARSIGELRYKDVLALERAVHRIAEAILDICRHLIAVYSLGLVESYGEYSKRLARAGKMPRKLAERISRLAGLRNILVHRYLEVDLRKLYEASREIVSEIVPEFLEWVKSIDP